jgi:hypothetical protein
MRPAAFVLTVFAVTASLWACTGGTVSAPTAPPRPTPSRGPLPSKAPSPTVEVVSPAGYPLAANGPWLVYRAGEAIFIANSDGSGHRVLYDGPTLPFDLDDAVAPSGSLLALYGFDDPAAQVGPWLRVVRMPLGVEVFSTPLLSSEIEAVLAEGTEGGSAEAEAATAVTLPDALAWSPDGQRLAFVAALHAISSDLYVYSFDRAFLSRVSSGPNQIASPSWSPDSSWIAHQAVEGFGTGAGWRMGSVWTVSPNGQRLNRLYAPESGGEVFLGWSRGGSLISYSFTQDGYRDLRAAGADGAVENVLISTYFDDAAYDLASGMVAYAVSENAGPGAEPGAYVWGPVMRDPLHMDARDWTTVNWAPGAGLFIFEGPSGVLAVTPEGEGSEIPRPGRAAVSPDGHYLALWGDGTSSNVGGIELYTTGLEFVRPLEDRPVSVVSWRPDSAGLMAVTEAGLKYYPLEGPSAVVDPSAAGIAEGGLGWVLP